MVEVYITKEEASRRQINAAIRILFGGEDPLAVHIVVAAALGVLEALDAKRVQPSSNGIYQDVLNQLSQKFRGANEVDLEAFKRWYRTGRNRSANFLKHADRDAGEALNPTTLSTDHLMLEACGLYMGMGFQVTPEMDAFARWHMAVYPHEPEDRLKTEVGYVDDLEREAQLQFGAYLLDQFMAAAT